MKKILIALDNNIGAQKVATRGYELSKALNASQKNCKLSYNKPL